MLPNDLPTEWDVVVVGAGIAGALSALLLARSQMRVLLVEKASWPRTKVCGGCLNASALRALNSVGIAVTDGRAYSRMLLTCCGRSATFSLPEGVAVSRERLDALLVAYAVRAGARFVSGVRARLGNTERRGRELLLGDPANPCSVTARMVLDCGGLGSRLLPGVEWRLARRARIGVGTCANRGADGYRAGVIHMACARHGYVGAVRAEGDRIDLAAALDPAWCSDTGGPAHSVTAILTEAGLPRIEGLDDLRWQGTPQLTCQRQALGMERVLIVGDAAGYVEPFTGEGMAWAIADAEAVVPWVRAAVVRWDDAIITSWSSRHARNLRMRRTICRTVSKALRHPRMLAAALPCLNAAPVLATPLSTWLNRDFQMPAQVQK